MHHPSLEQFNLHDIDALKKESWKIKRDIEIKKEDLRSLVGGRYRDIIDVADEISELKQHSLKLHHLLANIGDVTSRPFWGERQELTKKSNNVIPKSDYFVKLQEELYDGVVNSFSDGKVMELVLPAIYIFQYLNEHHFTHAGSIKSQCWFNLKMNNDILLHQLHIKLKHFVGTFVLGGTLDNISLFFNGFLSLFLLEVIVHRNRERNVLALFLKYRTFLFQDICHSNNTVILSLKDEFCQYCEIVVDTFFVAQLFLTQWHIYFSAYRINFDNWSCKFSRDQLQNKESDSDSLLSASRELLSSIESIELSESMLFDWFTHHDNESIIFGHLHQLVQNLSHLASFQDVKRKLESKIAYTSERISPPILVENVSAFLCQHYRFLITTSIRQSLDSWFSAIVHERPSVPLWLSLGNADVGKDIEPFIDALSSSALQTMNHRSLALHASFLQGQGKSVRDQFMFSDVCENEYLYQLFMLSFTSGKPNNYRNMLKQLSPNWVSANRVLTEKFESLFSTLFSWHLTEAESLVGKIEDCVSLLRQSFLECLGEFFNKLQSSDPYLILACFINLFDSGFFIFELFRSDISPKLHGLLQEGSLDLEHDCRGEQLFDREWVDFLSNLYGKIVNNIIVLHEEHIQAFIKGFCDQCQTVMASRDSFCENITTWSKHTFTSSSSEASQDEGKTTTKVFLPMESSLYVQTFLSNMYNHLQCFSFDNKTSKRQQFAMLEKSRKTIYRTLSQFLSSWAENPLNNSQMQCLQLWYDINFLNQVIVFDEGQLMNSLGSEDGEINELLQTILKVLEANVDPFDLETVRPHMVKSIVKACEMNAFRFSCLQQRTANVFGENSSDSSMGGASTSTRGPLVDFDALKINFLPIVSHTLML